MECAPLCKLEWIVEGQVVTGEEEQFTLDMEELEEDGEQFTSVFTTLTMKTEENKQKQLSATCRFSTFAFLCRSFVVPLCSIFLHSHFPIPFYILDMHQSYNYAKAAKVRKRTMDNLIIYAHGPEITRC